MPTYFDGLKKAKEMYWAGQKIREAWYEGKRVFSGKPVEVMPATPGEYDARDWLRAKLTEYGEDYATVKEIPFEIDAGEATTMRSLFTGCSKLVTAPAMDTRGVTNTSYLFYQCRSLIEVPPMNTAQVTDARNMFRECLELTDGNVRLIGKHQGVRTDYMIYRSGLTREPFYDSTGRPI